MLKRLVLLTGLLLTSLSAQATLISHFGYERHSASNIVTGGGLEWLKWDVTKGMSINSALSTYASQGWRLASNIEMASLFNSFMFDQTGWHASHVGSREIGDWDSGDELSPHAAINRLYGTTWQISCSTANRETDCYSNDDPLTYSIALAGPSEDGMFKKATIHDDYTHLYHGYVYRWDHLVEVSRADYTANWNSLSTGVALVRKYSPINAVPVPGSIGLLALGLFALGYRRRQVLGR